MMKKHFLKSTKQIVYLCMVYPLGKLIFLILYSIQLSLKFNRNSFSRRNTNRTHKESSVRILAEVNCSSCGPINSINTFICLHIYKTCGWRWHHDGCISHVREDWICRFPFMFCLYLHRNILIVKTLKCGLGSVVR